MAQIRSYQKGTTLIELLVYMGIFSIMMLMVSSSIFYLQKIIKNNNHNYYVKNQIYTNLTILQHHLDNASMTLENDELKLFSKTGKLIMSQKIQDGQPQFIYRDKNFNPYHLIDFQTYHMALIDKNRVVQIEISWLDMRGKPQTLVEYLIVINHIL